MVDVKIQDVRVQEVSRFDSGVSRLEAVGFILHELSQRWKKYLENPQKYEKKVKFWIELYYLILAALQVRNGLRASEAVKASFKLFKYNTRKTSLVALKHGLERPVVLPGSIDTYLFRKVMEKVISIYTKRGYQIDTSGAHRTNFEYRLVQAYDKWLKRNTPIKNSHSLRYAYIRYLVDLGLPLEVIERSLGHKKISTTYRYAQTYEIQKVFEDPRLDF